MKYFSHYTYEYSLGKFKIISRVSRNLLEDFNIIKCKPSTIKDILTYGPTKEIKETARLLDFNWTPGDNGHSHFKIYKGKDFKIVSKREYFNKEKRVMAAVACINDVIEFGNEELKLLVYEQLFNAPVKVDENDIQIEDIFLNLDIKL